MYLILGVLTLLLAAPISAGQPQAAPEGARILEGVEGFPLDYDSGNMGLHALSSCITAARGGSAYYSLIGLSGTAFKFVYDSTEAYEPLRDLYPVDVFRAAANAMGFPGARWEVNTSIDAVKSLIKSEIDSGQPLVAPFLKADAYHGFFVITGYDYDKNVFYLQGALGLDSGYAEVPIPEHWDGPTGSPEGWAVNPVFALGEARMGQEARGGPERRSVETGIRLFEGGTIEYGTHPGEGLYMGRPGPHTASYGLPAYELLSREVEGEPLLVEYGDGEKVNFGFIWRLDAQLGQLQHDRGQGTTYLRGLMRHIDPDYRGLLNEITESFEKVAAEVRLLRRLFWNPVPQWCAGPEDIMRYIEREKSIVYWIPDDDLAAGLADHGLSAHSTPWGKVLILDSPEKRLRAKVLVKSIATREKNSLYVMQDMVGHIGEVEAEPDRRQPDRRDGGRTESD